MKFFYLLIFSAFCLFSSNVFAIFGPSIALASFDCTITVTLRLGSSSEQVKCLQNLVGANADGRFGPLTKASVVSWQLNHGLVADGIVGPMTRAALFKDVVVAPVVNNGTYAPKVFGVVPGKVRSGDTVKIYGQNFSSIGNTVRLRYGQIEDRFENLPSTDGKIISFVYQPPEMKTMTREELLNLPDISNKILDPAERAGGSVDDLVAPYRNMQNEDQLRQFLQNNGHSFDELYDKFWVTVENVNGSGTTNKAVLSGLRKLSFGSNSLLSKNNFIFSIFNSLSEIFTPKRAYAQTSEGGYNSGFLFYCTCGSGYMTYINAFASNNIGTGYYYWAPGFVPTVGNPFISGEELGFFIQNAGSCVIIVGNSCATITANIASLPWGEAI